MILQCMTVRMLVDILFYSHIRIKSQIGGTEDVLGIASQVLGLDGQVLGLEGQVLGLGLVTSGLDSKSVNTWNNDLSQLNTVLDIQ